MKKTLLITYLTLGIAMLLITGCTNQPKPILVEPDGGIGTTNNREYVSQNLTQCAATTWICDEGMQQFYDETGCGCEQEKLSNNREYVSQNLTQCAATTWICDEGMQQFYDETGCRCERAKNVSTVSDSRQYISTNQTQCAATTWICNEGMQQFYDETGCGCEQKTPIPVEPIGGDKDKEGCLIGSGYFWNESIGACVRSWELNENEAKAAQIAVSPISTRPVTVVEVITARCPGCFEVKIQTGEGDPYIVSINNWKISNEKSCPDTCPLLSQPGPSFCSDGTIVDQGKDECGCQLPPKCEKENMEN
jgi:hypothetical protein